MRAIELALVLIALGAAASAPQEPESKSKSAAKTADSASEIVARLREESEHQSCTVTFKMSRAGKESTLRIRYAPPGEMSFEILNEEGTLECWVQPDRWVIRNAGPDDQWAGDFNPKEMFACEVFGVLKDEFPGQPVEGEDMGPGGDLTLRLHPDKPFNGDRYLEFELSWLPERHHPLDWISRPEEWSGARVEEKLLVLEYSSGARFSLSRDTGWPVEMSHPAGSHLELVDYKDSVEADDFDIPTPKAGMKDVTQQWMQGAAPAIFYSQRASVYAAGIRASRDDTYEKPVIAEKLVKAFSAIYTKEMRRPCFGDWSEMARKRIDGFADACEERLKQIGDDSTLRDELDAVVAEEKSELLKAIEGGIDDYVSKIPAFKRSTKESEDEDEPLDPQIVSEIFVSEETAARDAFQVEIAAPLLAKFDSDLRAIGALK